MRKVTFLLVVQNFSLDILIKTYHLESIFCVFCSIEIIRKTNDSLTFSIHGLLLILSISYVFYLHFQHRPVTCGQFGRLIEKTPKEKQGTVLLKLFTIAFMIPAIVLGTLLYFFIRY